MQGTGYAEAKTCCELYRAVMAADASRTGYAEAKKLGDSVRKTWPGRKPHRLLCKAKANVCRKAGNI